VFEEDEGYTQVAEMPGGEPPFETGVGGMVGGEVSIDGTPLRVSTIVVGAILLLIVFNRGRFRFHVVG
jgi:hypothetical protein